MLPFIIAGAAIAVAAERTQNYLSYRKFSQQLPSKVKAACEMLRANSLEPIGQAKDVVAVYPKKAIEEFINTLDYYAPHCKKEPLKKAVYAALNQRHKLLSDKRQKAADGLRAEETNWECVLLNNVVDDIVKACG